MQIISHLITSLYNEYNKTFELCLQNQIHKNVVKKPW